MHSGLGVTTFLTFFLLDCTPVSEGVLGGDPTEDCAFRGGLCVRPSLEAWALAVELCGSALSPGTSHPRGSCLARVQPCLMGRVLEPAEDGTGNPAEPEGMTALQGVRAEILHFFSVDSVY